MSTEGSRRAWSGRTVLITRANRGLGLEFARQLQAALDMQTRVQAGDLGGEGFICVSMSPGWVRTDMGGPNATLSPAESVRAMLATLAPLTRADTGKFFNHDGRELPW